MKKLLPVILAAAAAQAVTVKPQDDGRVLSNPNMGLTMHYYSNLPYNYGASLEPGDDMAWFPGCTVAYLRIPWEMLEPEEGVFNWSALDTPAQRWIARGGQIALRITCSEDWWFNATPKWFRDAGCPGKEYRFGGPNGPVRTPDKKTLPWDPDFGSPIFLQKLETLVAKLAERYNGRSEVAFVDIGSYGLWGEGHTMMSSNVSEAKRHIDIKRHIDLWCKYFDKTPLVISDDIDGPQNRTNITPLLDYAREKGVGWRDDSILVQAPPHQWWHSEQTERYWRTLPVVLEHEHYGGPAMQDPANSDWLVKSVEEHHASYMSIHGPAKKIYDERREAWDKINRIIGYRFLAKQIIWPDKAVVGDATAQPFDVSFQFTNGGVAPCLTDAFPCLTVKNDKGGIIAVLSADEMNLKGMLPQEVRYAKATFTFGRWSAPTVKPGEYDMYLSVGKRDGTPVYELPLPNGDGQRRYKLGKIVFTTEAK